MINVLVVDDSAVARECLVHLINSTPGMTVVGTAIDGLEAIDAVRRLRPTIITMDIVMPRMGGPDAIEQIMQQYPTPIVVVTGNTITEEVRTTFQSLESGALAIVARPSGIGSLENSPSAQHLVNTLRLMSEIKVVRRVRARTVRTLMPGKSVSVSVHPFRVVAIGASTGGPSALRTILNELPRDFPAPVLVVQHIAAGFVDGFVAWLRDTCRMTVKLAEQGEKLAAGVVYVAPDGYHFGLDLDERVSLLKPKSLPFGYLCPAVGNLFEAVLATYGAHAIAILLTGMGRDGADALLKLQNAGAMTIAQDKESSIVHGMPGEAITLGAANLVLPPVRIAELLNNLAQTSSIRLK